MSNQNIYRGSVSVYEDEDLKFLMVQQATGLLVGSSHECKKSDSQIFLKSHSKGAITYSPDFAQIQPDHLQAECENKDLKFLIVQQATGLLVSSSHECKKATSRFL